MTVEMRLGKEKTILNATCQLWSNHVSSPENFVSFFQKQLEKDRKDQLSEIEKIQVCDPNIRNHCRKIDAPEEEKEKLREKKIVQIQSQQQSMLRSAENFRQASLQLFPFENSSCFSAEK